MIKKYWLIECLLLFFLIFVVFNEQVIETFVTSKFEIKNNPVQWSSLSTLLLDHIKLVILSSSLATVIGVSLALIINYFDLDALDNLFVSLGNLTTTFPSIAVIALLVSNLGYGEKPVFIALCLYAFFPIFNSGLNGLKAVDKDLVLVGKSCGMNKLQILSKVKLPLSYKMILSGIKTAIIINIAMATIGSVVGANTLGLPIVVGIRSNNFFMILKGAVPVALMAFLFDMVFSRLEVEEKWKKS